MAVARRALSALAAVWLAVTLAFALLRLLPGDAIAAQLADSGAGAGSIAARRAALGLDAPAWTQYARYLGELARGDLGESLATRQPVSEMIAAQLPATLALAGAALVVAVGLGLTLGVLAALNGASAASAAARAVISLSLSAPVFWTGALVLALLADVARALPPGGGSLTGGLALPALVLGFHTAGSIARVTQANVRALLGADFTRAARARGLPERRILVGHVLRAALVPVVTVVALQAGFLLGGVAITERLFARPGIGRLLVDSTLRQDYPVVQGIVILSAVAYALLGLATDLLYRLLDPRVRA